MEKVSFEIFVEDSQSICLSGRLGKVIGQRRARALRSSC